MRQLRHPTFAAVPQRHPAHRPLSLAVAFAFSAGAALSGAGSAQAQALPTGGQVTAGGATISQTSATSMLVKQTTDRTAINWQSFSIGYGNTVRFDQPSTSSIALNRVIGNSRSEIYGSLTSNGQVFLINGNGILFGATAQVDVGGLVASTLNITDRNFLDGNFVFSDPGNTTSVINQGSLIARGNGAGGGTLALIGHQAINQGTMQAHLGSVVLGAGGTAQLTLADTKLVKFEVTQNALNALAENGGLIRANGGQVILTAGAKESLLASTVNNTGIIEAQTVDRMPGNILLLGGMAAGTVNVGGTLDASAPASTNPQGGNGGFIETSAAKVKITPGATVTTAAANGKSGTWLIDPADFAIAASGGDIDGATLGTSLNAGNVTIASTSGTINTAGNGDVLVNDTATWTASNTLTLNAQRNVDFSGGGTLNAGTGAGAGNVTLNAGLNGVNGAIIGHASNIVVTANTLTVNAASGIGSAATPLLTQATNAALTNTKAGGIYLTNTGNLTVAANSVNGDISIRTADGAANSFATGGSGGNIAVGTVGTLSGLTSTDPGSTGLGGISLTAGNGGNSGSNTGFGYAGGGGGSITLNAVLNSAQAVTLNAGTGGGGGVNYTSGGSGSGGGGGTITLNAALNSGQAATLNAGNGGAGGNGDGGDGGAITLNAALNAAQAATLNAGNGGGGGGSYGGSGGGGGAGGSITLNAALNAAQAAALSAGNGGAAWNGLNNGGIGGGIGGSIVINTPLSFAQAATLTAGTGGFGYAGNIGANGNVNGANIDITAAASLSINGVVAATSGNVALRAGMGAGSTLALNGVTVANPSTDNLTLQGNTITGLSGTLAANTLSVTAANAIGSAAAPLATSVNALALQSRDAYVTNDKAVTINALSATGTASLTTTGAAADISAPNAVTAATLNLATNGGNATFTNVANNIGTLGTVDLGTGSLTLSSAAAAGLHAGSISAAGVSLTSTATNGDLQVDGGVITNSGSAITLNAQRNIDFAGGGALNAGTGAGAGNVTLNAGLNGVSGAIIGHATNTIVTANTLTANALTGIGTSAAPLLTLVSNAALTNTQSGGIYLTNTAGDERGNPRDLTVAANSVNGDISIRTADGAPPLGPRRRGGSSGSITVGTVGALAGLTSTDAGSTGLGNISLAAGNSGNGRDGGSITLNAALGSAQAATLTAGNGGDGNRFFGAGNGGSITLNSALSSAQAATLTAGTGGDGNRFVGGGDGGSITLNAALGSAQAVTITAGNGGGGGGGFGVFGALGKPGGAGGSITLNAGINSAYASTLTAGNGGDGGGDSGNGDGGAGGSITLNAALSSAQAATLTAGNGGSGGGRGSVGGAGGGGGSITINAALSSAQTATLTAGNGGFGGGSDGSDVGFGGAGGAGGSITINAALSSEQTATLNAGNGGAGGAGGNANAGGAGSDAGRYEINSAVSTNSDMILAGATGGSGGVGATNGVAGRDTAVTGSNISLAAAGSLSIAAAVQATSGNVSLRAGMNAGNTLTLKGVSVANATTDDVTLQGNSISASGSLAANTLSVTTANGIGTSAAPLLTQVNNAALHSTQGGGIYLTNTGDLTVAARSVNGDIVIRTADGLNANLSQPPVAGGNITVGSVNGSAGLFSTGTGDITVSAGQGGGASPNGFFGQSYGTAGGSINVNAPLISAGAVNLAAGTGGVGLMQFGAAFGGVGGAINVNAGLSAGGAVSLTAGNGADAFSGYGASAGAGGSIVVNGGLNAGGAATLTAGSAGVSHTFGSASSPFGYSGGSITANAALNAGGAITLTAGDGSTMIGGNPAKSGDGGSITLNAALNSTQAAKLNAGNAGDSYGGDGGAGGSITLSTAPISAQTATLNAGKGGNSGNIFNYGNGGAGGAGGSISGQGPLSTSGSMAFAAGAGGNGGDGISGGNGGNGGTVGMQSQLSAGGSIVLTAGAAGNGGYGNGGGYSAFTGGNGGIGGSVNAQSLRSASGGITLSAGSGGNGGDSNSGGSGGGSGGAGGNVVTQSVSSASGNDVLIAGAGGVGGNSLGPQGNGGAGGAGGGVLTQNLLSTLGSATLTAGIGGAGGNGGTGGTGGTGGAGGAVDAQGSLDASGGLTLTTGNGGNAGNGGYSGNGGNGGTGGAVTTQSLRSAAGNIALAAGNGGTGGYGAFSAGAGGNGGSITTQSLLSAGGSIGLTAGSGAADGFIRSVGGTGSPAGSGTGGNVTLGGGLSAAGHGDAILISGANFINNAGANALNAPNGRWIVWSNSPVNDVFGGLKSGNTAVWGTAYDPSSPTVAQTGNRFVFSTPQLTSTALVRADDQTKTYGDTFTNFTYTGTATASNAAAGATYGNAFTDAGGAGGPVTVSGALLSSAGAAAGAKRDGGINGGAVYDINVNLGGASAAGYSTLIAQNGFLTINPLALTGSITASGKTYDGTAGATIATRTLTGVVNGDAVSYAGGTAGFGDKNAGLGKTVSATGLSLTGTGAINYTVNTSAITTADIAQLALTGLITASNKTYDATTAATIASRTLTGVLAGDSVSYTGGTAAFGDKNAATGKTVTATGLGLSGADAGNYSVHTSASTTANIAQAALTLGSSAQTRTYDGTTGSTGTVGVSGLLGTDAVTGLAQSFDSKNAGARTLVVNNGYTVNDGNNGGNYAVTVVNAAGTINSLALNGSITASNKTYDATTAATIASRTLTGVLNGDVVSYTGGTASFGDKNAGNGKTVSASGLGLTGADAINYTVNAGATTLANITPRGIAVAANNATKVYGDADPGFTFAVGGAGFAGADTAATVMKGAMTRVAGENVAGGPYAINQGTLTINTNYTITGFTPGLLGITPRALTITADNKTGTSGLALPAFTASYAGFAFTDTSASLTGALRLTTPATSASPAGSYGITPSGQSSTNYAIRYVPGVLTMQPKVIVKHDDDDHRPKPPKPPKEKEKDDDKDRKGDDKEKSGSGKKD